MRACIFQIKFNSNALYPAQAIPFAVIVPNTSTVSFSFPFGIDARNITLLNYNYKYDPSIESAEQLSTNMPYIIKSDDSGWLFSYGDQQYSLDVIQDANQYTIHYEQLLTIFKAKLKDYNGQYLTTPKAYKVTASSFIRALTFDHPIFTETKRVNKISLFCSMIGIAAITAGALYFANIDLLTRDIFLIGGSAIVSLAMFTAAYNVVHYKQHPNCTSLDTNKIDKSFLVTLTLFLILGLGFGYGVIHTEIGFALQNAGLDLAATIAVKCALSGFLGVVAGYFCARMVPSHEIQNNSKPDTETINKSIKENLLTLSQNISFAITLGLATIAGTIVGPLATSAMGICGDTTLAIEVMLSSAAMSTVLALIYLPSAFYSAYKVYKTQEAASLNPV